MTTFTKDQIKTNIVNDIRWTIRSLEVLFNRQTTDEQVNHETSHLNGRGFNGTDAEILTSFYYQIQKRKHYGNPVLLSEKQLGICKKKLPKYWKQIQEEIQIKQSNQ
jgi:hypothetical protein